MLSGVRIFKTWNKEYNHIMNPNVDCSKNSIQSLVLSRVQNAE